MPTLFHPPTTLDPLQVDDDKQGSDSDHLMVVFAPILNQKYKVVRMKKTIITRPLPEDKINNLDLILLSMTGMRFYQLMMLTKRFITFTRQ